MFLRAARALAVHPELWPTAVLELWRMARPGWWHHWPPLPRPDPAYLRFRMQTAYGDAFAVPSARELVDFLDWCHRMNSLAPRRAIGRLFKSASDTQRRASVAPVSPEPPAATRWPASDRRRRYWHR